MLAGERNVRIHGVCVCMVEYPDSQGRPERETDRDWQIDSGQGMPGESVSVFEWSVWS